jgi:hypothetical protein
MTKIITAFREYATAPKSKEAWTRLMIAHYKVKFTLEHTMKTKGKSRDTVYPFFKLDARLGLVANATPRPLYPRKEPRYPPCRRLGGPWGRNGLVRKISPLPPNRVRTPNRPARSESLCRLSYTGRQDYLQVRSYTKDSHSCRGVQLVQENSPFLKKPADPSLTA